MDVVKINENTYRIEDGMVRFFVLLGSEKALMIDTGMNTPDAIDAARKITDKPIELLNTHADRDHISGNGAFEKMYMSLAEEECYREAGGKGEIIPIKDGDIIDLGNRPLEIIEIPGHTPGSVAIIDINNRVLISGDSVQAGTIFMFGKHRNMEAYIESMKKLSNYVGRFDEIYPSHGPFPVYPDIIQKLIEGAGSILKGEAEGKETVFFGNKVNVYQLGYAGFFYNK